MKLTGRSTESKDRDAATMALNTSLAPRKTESRRLKPMARYRSTFSETTIESSTTIPMAMMSARRETRLKEKPASRYRTGAADSAMGMAKMTESAVFNFPRKSRTMMATTMAVMKSSWYVESTEAWMGPVVSLLISIP